MATTIAPRLAQSVASAPPIWLLPQALSLEAPLVAGTWLWFFARSFTAPVDPAELFLIAAVVWIIYVVDHLLDVRAGSIVSYRHSFVQAHRVALTTVILTLFLASLLCLSRLPHTVLVAGFALSGFVSAYFILVHLGGTRLRALWPKELAMGILFAAGCSITLWQLATYVWPAVLLFAALCVLNCASLDYWEWQSISGMSRPPHVLTRFLGRQLPAFALVLATLSLALFVHTSNHLYLAIALSAVLLIAIRDRRRALRVEATRLLSDAALLTPLLFLVK